MLEMKESNLATRKIVYNMDAATEEKLFSLLLDKYLTLVEQEGSQNEQRIT